jgi:hypothetical protein
MSGYSNITVEAQGRYRVDGGDWSVNDPDCYPDPESGNKNLEYDDPEAPPPPQRKNESLNNQNNNNKPNLTIETEPLFFNPSRIPDHAENSINTEASASYSYASNVRNDGRSNSSSSSSSRMRMRKDSFNNTLSGGTAPTPSGMMSPHEAIKQVPHQVRRPLTSRLRVNSSESTQSTMGNLGSEANRRFKAPSTVSGVLASMHPGNDIIWHGCYLWKIPYSSNKLPKVRWVQSVHDVAPNGGRGVYLKWHDPKNTRKQARSLPISSIAEIVIGQKTNAFFTQVNKRGRDSLPPVSLCFSLICNERTVDLAATNEEDFNGWTNGLKALLQTIQHQPSVKGFSVPKTLQNGGSSGGTGVETVAALTPVAPAVTKNSALTPNELKKVWMTTLFDHCRHNRLNEVKEILNDGCDVDLMERGTGDTALMVACRKGRTHIVKLCLERGAKNDPHPQFGQTALQAAIAHGTFYVYINMYITNVSSFFYIFLLFIFFFSSPCLLLPKKINRSCKVC